MCGLSVEESDPKKIIEIPRSSFTAFRLCYASADEISVLAKTELVGGIPAKWVSFVESSQHTESSSGNRRRKLWKRASRNLNEGCAYPLGESLFNAFLQDTHESSMKQLYRMLLRPDVMNRSILNRFKYDQDILQQEFLRQFDDAESNSSSNSQKLNIIQNILKHEDDSTSSTVDSAFASGNLLRSSNDVAYETTSSLVEYVPQYSNPNSPSTNGESSVNSKVLEPVTSTKRVMKQSAEWRVKLKLKSSRRKSRRTHLRKQPPGNLNSNNKIRFVPPEPECEQQQNVLRNEIIKHEKSNSNLTKKFKKLLQRKNQRKRKKRLRVHLIDHIKMFAEGKIVRLDKMLVLVKQAPRIFNLKGFNEFSTIATVVEERWREYFVVLRRGQSDLLVGQLYKTGRGRDFSKPPQFSFRILQEICVNFYSLMDKSISVVQSTDTGSRIFIMNARYYSLSLKWLYLIKECLEEEFSLLVDVLAKNTGQTFKVNLRKAFLKEAHKPTERIEIMQENRGYKIYEELLFQHVFRKINSRFSRLVMDKTKQRQELNRSSFWLACRFNGRLEWIPNNSLSLLVLSQLFAVASPLELIPMPTNEIIEHYSTVEGFLGQMSKNPKSQPKVFKFDKVLYFFLAQDLLFISSLNDATPPSPQNGLLRPNRDCAELAAAIPENFTYNLFSLDSNGHIPWLDSPTFFRKDRQALEEYSRKVTQAVLATSVINICLIKEVRAIKDGRFGVTCMEDFVPLYLAEQGKEFTGAAFEIEFSNSSVMRLLAPSYYCRDLWISKLDRSARFWRKLNHNKTASMLRIKETNQKRAGTNDALDLNSSFNQFGTIEETHEEALPHNLAVSVLSMSSVILCSGELFFKRKKNDLFLKKFAVLCPGYLMLYSSTKGLKSRSGRIRLPVCEKQHTIPLSDCYIHTEYSTQHNENEVWTPKCPGQDLLPRLFSDGWKSTTESERLRFTLWHGRKRKLSRDPNRKKKGQDFRGELNLQEVIKVLRVRGRALVFQARSKHELELWVHSILEELNRFAYE